ncbi:MAG: hypothetical protein RL069_133, partial [Planctomycetota bacterium]
LLPPRIFFRSSSHSGDKSVSRTTFPPRIHFQALFSPPEIIRRRLRFLIRMTPTKPAILPCPSNSLRASLLSLGVDLLPDATIDQLATASSRLLSPPNSILFREGESQPFLFLIESGQIELSMRAPGRPNVRILSLCNGNILAWSALLNQQPMTCSATTLSDCELLRIPATPLLETISAFPSFGVRFLHQINLALSERLTATRLQLLDLYHPHNA